MSSITALERLPEARTESILDLLLNAKSGRIRIPEFQRGLKWESKDVVLLFDSIIKGLPIGSLLFWKRSAEAAKIKFGPIELSAPHFEEAWWVVDGQQRLTSLAASLLRSLPLSERASKKDPFVVYFNSKDRAFTAAPASGQVPTDWVPLPALLDASFLSEWIHEWKPGKNAELRKAVFDAGRRIREYKVPLYLVESADEELLKEIFSRVNNTGKALRWEDVYDALYGRKGRIPSTTEQVTERLAKLGMGVVDRSTVVTCIIGMRGLDVTRPLSEYTSNNKDVLRGASQEVYRALQQVLVFLRKQAAIPHLRLLPSTVVLPVLARFFHLHAEPSARTRALLARWVWRTFLSDRTLDERTLVRRSISVIGNNEEASIIEMLKLIGKAPRKAEIPEAFDARSAENRIVLLALNSLQPRDLKTGSLVDPAALIEKQDIGAFKRIVVVKEVKKSKSSRLAPENVMFQEGVGSQGRLILERIRKYGTHDSVLESHGIDESIAKALAKDPAKFLVLRRARIQQAVSSFGAQMAAWGRDRDRPSIGYLLGVAQRGTD